MLGLYVWEFLFGENPLTHTMHVGDLPGLSAGVTLFISVVLYFWIPEKLITIAAALVYGLIVLTTGSLVATSGGVHSPFIALWMAISIFAGLFGVQGIIAVLVVVNAYIVYSFLGQSISRPDIIMSALAGELPMFISYILWTGRESLEVARDHDVSGLNKTLEQESSKSEAIIKSIGDGVLVVSQTGEILVINPAAQQMTGWTSNDSLHLHYESVLKLEDEKGNIVPGGQDPIAKVLNTGQQVRENNLSVITKSGKHVVAAFVVSPMGDNADGAIAVFRDVTKERAEEKQQSEFISTASHEMRTPVASIEGYLGLALNPNTATIDEKARDFINKAHDSAQHLGHLFQDLLDVSKADDGRLQNNPVVINVVDFAREIIDGLRPKAEEKGLVINYKPDGTKTTAGTTVISPVLYSHVDRDHLREVIANLIENAIKYTPEGEVTVDVNADNDYVKISVKDSGIGIPAEDVPHLFQKFYRVDNTATREIGGTGLGLYLCRKLVEAMEGHIRVDSEFKKGSTFYVDVPRIDHSEASVLLDQEAREKAAAQSGSGTKIPVEVPETPLLDQIASETLAPETPAPVLPTIEPLPTETPTPVIVEAVAPEPIMLSETPNSGVKRFGAVSYDPSSAPETPAPMPTLPPQLAPETPAPVLATPRPAPTAIPQQPVRLSPAQVERTNTPLSALERNPEQYLARRPESPN